MKITSGDLHKLPHRVLESKTAEGVFMCNDAQEELNTAVY